MNATSRTLDRTVRGSYGKLLSALLARGFALDEAEDGLGQAIEKALASWPLSAPDNPEAWLMRVAVNSLIDSRRRQSRWTQISDDLLGAVDDREPEVIPDERLKLLYLCTHPAIDVSVQTPLMLQLVLGFNAEEIAGLYGTNGSAMGQRLVRAKSKIKAAGIRPDLPTASELASRSQTVRDAVYGFYTLVWNSATHPEHTDWAREAVDLAKMIAELDPVSPESLGLAALVCLTESRRAARTDAMGRYVPLDEQDTRRWDYDLISDGERYLSQAAQFRRAGRYQIEAAIQSAHHARCVRGTPEWSDILALYESLVQLSPTVVAELGRIAVYARVAGAHAALDQLRRLNAVGYQPFWALKAHLLAEVGDAMAASIAAKQAIALSKDPAAAEYLAQIY